MKTFWSVFFAILAAAVVIAAVAGVILFNQGQEQGWRDAADASLKYGSALAYSIQGFPEKEEVARFNELLAEAPSIAEKLDGSSRRQFISEVRRLHSVASFGTKGTQYNLVDPPPEWP